MVVTPCLNCVRLEREVAELRAQVERLTRLLEEQRRSGKRQSAPFAASEPAFQSGRHAARGRAAAAPGADAHAGAESEPSCINAAHGVLSGPGRAAMMSFG